MFHTLILFLFIVNIVVTLSYPKSLLKDLLNGNLHL